MNAAKKFLIVLIVCSGICVFHCAGFAEEEQRGQIALQFSLRGYFSEIRVCSPSCGSECNLCKPYRVINDIGSDSNYHACKAEMKKLFVLPTLESGPQELTIFMKDADNDVTTGTFSVYVAADDIKVYTVDLLEIESLKFRKPQYDVATSDKRFKTMEGFQEWAFDNGYQIFE
ncbi:hypothetical protein ACFL38_00130 [Candidatus Omnitrophota bacterium]